MKKIKRIFLLTFMFTFILSSLMSCLYQANNKSTLYTNCKLRVADGGSGVGIGFPRYEDRLASTGTVNVKVIMVDFPDAAATLTPAAAYAKISGATATFNEMSYGRFNYSLSPVLHWYRMSKRTTQYSYSNYESHHAYIQEAIELADADVDFSSVDSVVILANPDAATFWPIGPARVDNPGFGVTADGKELLNVVTSGHDLNSWGSIWLNHEATHTLGLIDLYAYNGGHNNLSFTGEFSYMGLNSFDSNSPGLTAWERWLLEWIDDDQIQCANPLKSGSFTTLITPMGVTGGKKAVMVPVGNTKVLVVESRRAQGIDANIQKTGALVYTVDSSIGTGKGAIQVYPINASDPLYKKSIRKKGESVSVGKIKVEVLSSTSAGDRVRISASDNFFSF